MWVKPPRNARGSIFECAPELPGRGFAKCDRTFRRVFNEFVPYSADKRNQFADARPARRDERTARREPRAKRARARRHETKLTCAASLANSPGPELRGLLSRYSFFPSRVEGKKKGLRCITRACAWDFGRFRGNIVAARRAQFRLASLRRGRSSSPVFLFFLSSPETMSPEEVRTTIESTYVVSLLDVWSSLCDIERARGVEY